MARKTDNGMFDDDDDQLSDIFEDREEGEDETSDVIRGALKAQGIDTEEDDDGAGFDQPPLEEGDADDRVSQEEGTKLATDAQLKSEIGETDKDKKPDSSSDDDGDKDAEDADKADKTADKTPDKSQDAPDLTAAPLDQLMKDVPEASRAELTRRLSDADKMLAPFQTEYAQSQMRQFGSTPQEMSARLVQLAEYASTKPDEYLAWAAREMAGSPEKIGEVLGKAAALHGYKVVKDEADGGEDDIFDDEETKALKKRVRELEGQLGGGKPEFGPDTPALQQERQTRDALTGFTTERNTDGTLKRPHFEALQGRITQLAQAQVQQTRQPVTIADLDRLYQQAETEARSMFGNPAAQQADPKAEQDKKKAAAAEKARRASTSIDGTGQGASRRPALEADADIEDVLRFALNKSVDG